MSGQPRRWNGKSTARGLRRLAWPGVLAAIFAGLSMSTCGNAASTIDRCEGIGDCPATPHMACIDSMCTCEMGYIPCNGECNLSSECSPGAGGADGGGSGGSSGSGQGGKCNVAADCPQPGDPHCGTATCENGVCGLELMPFGPLSSQVRGDCKELSCDGDGNLVEAKEASDKYDDGAECTWADCDMGAPVAMPYSNGSACPENDKAVCYEGDCVACIPNMVSCGGGLACQGFRCVPMHCVNLQWDQGLGELAEDCGGPCYPCPSGDPCKTPADCRSGVCLGGVCQPPTCSDGVKNDNETGTDCGGPPNCPRCPVGQGCKVGSDCLSKVCWAGLCEPPTCEDGIQNGDETDWDCGGPCAPCP